MKKNIISLNINQGTKIHYINEITNRIIDKKYGYVCFANVHMLVESYDNPDFAVIVNSGNYVFPDGFPLAKSFKLIHNISQERIAGMDFFPDFLKVCNDKKFRVGFVGSTKNILIDLKSKIKIEFPNILVTELISPPFGEVWDDKKYVKDLNDSRTDVVFVALGCPKQEKWMFKNSKNINAMLFGIGGALPTYVGVVQRAPNWMRVYGLEWFYRLLNEPKRMFKRYCYTNTKFIWLTIVNLLKFKL